MGQDRTCAVRSSSGPIVEMFSNFPDDTMNCVLETMNFVLEMMGFAPKTIDFVFEMQERTRLADNDEGVGPPQRHVFQVLVDLGCASQYPITKISYETVETRRPVTNSQRSVGDRSEVGQELVKNWS